MRCVSDRAPYCAPQSEIIEFQIEDNFLDSTEYSAPYNLESGGLGNGDELR